LVEACWKIIELIDMLDKICLAGWQWLYNNDSIDRTPRSYISILFMRSNIIW